jgi:class 3 adenylate cyclase
MTEPPVPSLDSSPGVDAPAGSDAPADLVQAGRDAFERHAWLESFEALSGADAAGALAGPELELLAEAAFFAGRADARIGAKERAFKAYQDAGDEVRAGYLAVDVAREHAIRRRLSIASGWVRRAERLLEGKLETYAHGYLALARSEMSKEGGDLSTAMSQALEAAEIGTRTGNADLRALALTLLAMLRIGSGDAKEGFALLEEAAIAAVGGELSLIIAGFTSCSMIAACRELTDYRRASEWLEATDAWCKRQDLSGFPGICRIHRAEIVALHGGWEQAEQELRRATSELAGFDAIPPMADGLYTLGDIRRLRGDAAGAEDALRQAHALGRSPQPALALIRLADGKVKAASAAIDAALEESGWNRWQRARLLAAQVEIAIASGDVGRARAAADELSRIVEGYPSPALTAGQHEAVGRALLAEGEAPAAIRELRAAIDGWREVGSPYQMARVRAVLSRALRTVGDEDDADLELRAARDEFERLGALPDLTAADEALREREERLARPGQTLRTFMFTDIVGSTNLAEALGDEAWERLLRWHDDTLRSLVVRHGGEVVKSTGDGFFVAFESGRTAIASAIAIQRALAEHRDATGFVPPVRIGLHSANATRRGHDYSGIGVHVAARVAALASGGEIYASEDTLGEAGDVTTSGTSEVSVKGIAAPIRVATIAWS